MRPVFGAQYMVLYNVLQLLRAWAAFVAAEPTPVQALSAEEIFTDLHEERVGLHHLLAVEELQSCLELTATAESLRALLGERLQQAWSALWRKAVNTKRRPHKPKAKQSGVPSSVHKILQAAKAERLKKQKVSPSSG